MNLSRKDFLCRGVLSVGELLLRQFEPSAASPKALAPLRPPGFSDELRERCGSCDLCVHACPHDCLARQQGVAGPVFTPRLGECTFCADCVAACPRGVLGPFTGEPRLGVAVVDNDRCLARQGGCFTCEERCPSGALAIDRRLGLVIDQDRCTGCGRCEYYCPLEITAIRIRAVSP
jgi:ferredoxin-type protein NapG